MKPDGSDERILTEGFHNEGPDVGAQRAVRHVLPRSRWHGRLEDLHDRRLRPPGIPGADPELRLGPGVEPAARGVIGTRSFSPLAGEGGPTPSGRMRDAPYYQSRAARRYHPRFSFRDRPHPTLADARATSLPPCGRRIAGKNFSPPIVTCSPRKHVTFREIGGVPNY